MQATANALATTFTKDWYVGVFRPDADSRQQMRAARASTVGFAVLLAVIVLHLLVMRQVGQGMADFSASATMPPRIEPAVCRKRPPGRPSPPPTRPSTARCWGRSRGWT